MTSALLRIRGLDFAYADRAVFRNWSADIGAGVTWIVGDERCGKTTQLRLLAGRLQGTGSIAWINGDALVPAQVTWHEPDDERSDRLPVAEFFAQAQGAQPSFDAAALDRHIDGFGLRAHVDKALYQLSTGTRRKVLIAAGLASGAPLTLLDDPTAALDAASVVHLMRTLAEAATNPARAWIATGYEPPRGLPRAQVVVLPALD